MDLVRCERCAVGIHPACAVDYSEWSGKVGEPGGYYDRRDILRGALLCCKCFDEYLPYAFEDDPESTANGGKRRLGLGAIRIGAGVYIVAPLLQLRANIHVGGHLGAVLISHGHGRAEAHRRRAAASAGGR